MSEVFYNSNGGPLTAKAVFLGDIVADYGLFLKEANSGSQTLLLEGDNLNPEDDTRVLPTPVGINNGRRVKLETGFQGIHPDVNKNFRIVLEIHQDGNLIGSDQETGELSGNGQFSLLFIKLTAQ